MIEFTIPLNLPVRAVEITDAKSAPSIRLQHEMFRWAQGNFGGSVADSDSAQSSTETTARDANTDTPAPEPMPIANELQQEREALLQQQKLFLNATREIQRVNIVVQKQLEGLLLSMREAAVELGHAIAAKLMFEEVDRNRFPIANLVHEVVSRLDTSATPIVSLHPEDLALIQQLSSIEGQDAERSVKYIADSTLARGDCKAKAGEIMVIYELRRQIDEIRRQILSTVSGHAET